MHNQYIIQMLVNGVNLSLPLPDGRQFLDLIFFNLILLSYD